MSRWKPGARERLEESAYELFRDRGYDATTVANIAARADLSERTFFRHYADKREAFFGGSAHMEAAMIDALDAMPPGSPAIDAARASVEAMAGLMHGRHGHAVERYAIIDAHDALRERDLIKRAALTAKLSHALERRGLAAADASLAADVGMSIFYTGFRRWLGERTGAEFVEVVRAEFDRLKAVVAGSPSTGG